MTSSRKKYQETPAIFAGLTLNRWVFILTLGILAICIIWASFINYFKVQNMDGLPIVNWLKQIYWLQLHHLSQPLSANANWFYFGIPTILFLTWLKPAIKHQKLFDNAIACDFLWMFIHTIMTTGLIFVFIHGLEGYVAPIFQTHDFSFFGGAPWFVEIIVGYLAVEFLGWFSHLLRHKIPALWLFHEVHHSQKNMNPFTLFRVHPVDYLMAEVIIFIPALFFENTLGIVVAYLVIAKLQDALSHSNIKTNYGWLRYIFVTPQSHRVHHSIEKEFFDLNYGVTLCVWDRLFGTHSHSDHCYPKTGIRDPAFPLETEKNASQMLSILAKQLVYPFKKAINSYWLKK